MTISELPTRRNHSGVQPTRYPKRVTVLVVTLALIAIVALLQFIDRTPLEDRDAAQPFTFASANIAALSEAPSVPPTTDVEYTPGPTTPDPVEVPPTPDPTPPVVPAPAPAAVPATYTVVPDDCLSHIAPKFGTNTQTLIDLNPQLAANPDHIEPTWVINVPAPADATLPALELQSATTVTPAVPALAPVVEPAPVVVPEPQPAPKEYTVVKGDELKKIAERLGMTQNHLHSLNTDIIRDADVIVEGMVLKLTGEPKPLPAPPAPEPAPSSNGDSPTPAAPTHTHDTPSDPPPASASGSGRGAQAVAFAMAQLGDPYVWGGNGPNAWDCSGLLKAAWAKAGVTIPRVSTVMLNSLPEVSRDSIQPGDIVGKPGHVVMFVGNGQYIAAPQAGRNVELGNANGSYFESLYIAVRPGG